MAGTLTPSWFLYFTDSVGAPLSGGKVYTYATGTSTPVTVYQDASLAVPWSNPIILPADGKVTIYQDAETIKAVVKDSDDNLQDSYDPIASTALNSSLGGSIFSFEGDDFYPITATAYPTGTTVSTIHPGTSLFSVDSNNLVGTYVLQGMLQAGAAERSLRPWSTCLRGHRIRRLSRLPRRRRRESSSPAPRLRSVPGGRREPTR